MVLPVAPATSIQRNANAAIAPDIKAAVRLAALRIKARRLGAHTNPEYREDWELCKKDPAHFIRTHVRIYDATPGVTDWIPFDLWPVQEEVLEELMLHRLLEFLKARQQGFTWLLLGYALWLMLCKPSATVLMFSKGDEEAIELLDFRLKGMYERVPDWLRELAAANRSSTDTKHNWLLSNGSRAKAFPTTGGRSYTGTFVLVDEADFIPNLGKLITAVKPTIDAGGQMALVSTPDKAQPQSQFKRIYRAAKKGENDYRALFYGWEGRPGRTVAWYEAQKRDVLARTGSLDELHQEYPATDMEALSPNSLDKRITPAWLLQCYEALAPVPSVLGPALPELRIYKPPRFGVEYVIGADPAEGNPTSDDSSFSVLERVTGEEVATLTGKYEPKAVFPSHIKAVGIWYNRAGVLVERNNHGHAVIGWLQGNGYAGHVLRGTDGKPGWLTTSTSKTLMYDTAADAFRQGDTRLHSEETFLQLSSIDGSKLEAPDGERDDAATGYALALMARGRASAGVTTQSNYMRGGHNQDDDD